MGCCLSLIPGFDHLLLCRIIPTLISAWLKNDNVVQGSFEGGVSPMPVHSLLLPSRRH